MFFSSQPEYEYFNKETGLWKDFYPKEVDNKNNKNTDNNKNKNRKSAKELV